MIQSATSSVLHSLKERPELLPRKFDKVYMNYKFAGYIFKSKKIFTGNNYMMRKIRFLKQEEN